MGETPVLNNYNILIAEDDNSNYEYLRLLLSKTGATVHRASDGEEAVSRYSEIKDLHLILMDIRMPKLNGHLATRKIRALGAKIPIIAQTAYATPEDIEKAMAHGCDDYISKPIRKAAFFDKITRHLN